MDEAPAVDPRDDTMVLDGQKVFPRPISDMPLESVLGMTVCQIDHRTISGDFGEDGGGSNGQTQIITIRHPCAFYIIHHPSPERLPVDDRDEVIAADTKTTNGTDHRPAVGLLYADLIYGRGIDLMDVV